MGLYSVYDRGINDALQRRLGIKDDVGINLMPELAPILDIDAEPELQYLLGWRTWTVQFGFAALAANAQEFQFQNPNASKLIIILDEITVSSSVNDQIVVGQMGTQNNANLTTPVVVHSIVDGRMRAGGGGALPGGQASISTQQAASVGGSNGLHGRVYQLLANTSYTLPGRPFIFLPGSTMLFGFQAVNAIQFFCLTWRERQLNDQEGGV